MNYYLQAAIKNLPGIPVNSLIEGDCLQGMHLIKDKSIDLVLADLPFGVTANKWDKQIPLHDHYNFGGEVFETKKEFKAYLKKLGVKLFSLKAYKKAGLWTHYERIIKDDGAIVLFAQGMFAYKLALSNPGLYRYDIIWRKSLPTGHLNASRMPLRSHEHILVFYKNLPAYNPQFGVGIPKKGKQRKDRNGANYGKFSAEAQLHHYFDDGGKRFPTSVIDFSNGNKNKEFGRHSTQKPLYLLRYLVRTFSDPGDTVLDNCMGSATTIIACLMEQRAAIGFEKDPKSYKEAISRTREFLSSPELNFSSLPAQKKVKQNPNCRQSKIASKIIA